MSQPPATQFSITLDVTLDNVPGVLGRLATAIGEAGGNIFAIEGFVAKGRELERDIVVNCSSVEHQKEVVEAVEATEGVTLEGWYDRTFRMHEGGKIEMLPLCSVADMDDLSMAYTPGVARVCKAIEADEALADELTIRKNTVAIVSDGTAVLGLGDIGPKGAMPVMEGKALLFKAFAGVDAFPICLDVDTPEEIIDAVIKLAPTFGGINLEDIAAPGAFQVEEALKEHDLVHDAVVVGLPDERFGQAITAVVEPVVGGSPDEGELIDHVKGRLAGYTAPKRVVTVDSLGRAANGKVDYKRWTRHAAGVLGADEG